MVLELISLLIITINTDRLIKGSLRTAEQLGK